MIKHLHFTDLPAKQRTKMGAAAIREFRRALFLPLPDDHRQRIEQKIAQVSEWMQAPDKAPTPAPVHHEVTVSEGLQVAENIK